MSVQRPQMASLSRGRVKDPATFVLAPLPGLHAPPPPAGLFNRQDGDTPRRAHQPPHPPPPRAQLLISPNWPLCRAPEEADSSSSSQWDICISGLFFIIHLSLSKERHFDVPQISLRKAHFRLRHISFGFAVTARK